MYVIWVVIRNRDKIVAIYQTAAAVWGLGKNIWTQYFDRFIVFFKQCFYLVPYLLRTCLWLVIPFFIKSEFLSMGLKDLHNMDQPTVLFILFQHLPLMLSRPVTLLSDTSCLHHPGFSSCLEPQHIELPLCSRIYSVYFTNILFGWD